MSEPIHQPREDHAAPENDGRRRRRQQSRAAILQALAEAIAEPDFQPSPEWLAARSGYSISTIFRHFGNRDGLAVEIQGLVRQRIDMLLAPVPYEGDLDDRMTELVRRLGSVFEAALPFLRAVTPDRQRATGDPARRILDVRVRCQLEDALAPELSSEPNETVDLLAALLSVGAWDHVRNAQGHDTARAAELLCAAALRLLRVSGAGPRS